MTSGLAVRLFPAWQYKCDFPRPARIAACPLPTFRHAGAVRAWGLGSAEVTSPDLSRAPLLKYPVAGLKMWYSKLSALTINQRDENPVCHLSPLIKLLPAELSSSFCCWCTRWEVTWLTLAEPPWLCHTDAAKNLYTCTCRRSVQVWFEVRYVW